MSLGRGGSADHRVLMYRYLTPVGKEAGGTCHSSQPDPLGPIAGRSSSQEGGADHGILQILLPMNPVAIQQALFVLVKERIPAHLSLPDELAALLEISADSAYRRIRGEKIMDLGELAIVCRRFNLSVDGVLSFGGASAVFSGSAVGSELLPFTAWLKGMNTQLEQIADTKECAFIFRAEDIPTFHHFQFPALAQFKLFFWRRTILNDPAFQTRSFDLDDRDEDLLAIARKTCLTYLRMPSTEIWNADSLNAFLRQVTFYRDSGIFAKEQDVEVIFDTLLALVDHLQAETAAGVKFLHGEPSSTGSAAFQVYVNEVMHGDNMIYAKAGATRMVFVNHSAINYLSTTNEAFCDQIQQSMDNVMRRSVLISGTGEKERNRYFKALRDEVARRRQ
jgi:hypothetical protein